MNYFIAWFLFIVKHFVVDFLLQRKYQYHNKGVYGHPGGILHAFLHGLFTGVIVYIISPDATIPCAWFDFMVHYHIDYVKTRVNNYYELTPSNDKFWLLLGLDQCLHYLTYWVILFLLYGI